MAWLPSGASTGSPPDRFRVFAGYLVLDALIANRDRHEQNWAVLLPPGELQAALAPSYDHATSLGFNFRDSKRQAHLAMGSGQIEEWVRRGTAHRFEARPDGEHHTLVDLARQALGLAAEQASSLWLGKVAALTKDDVQAVVDRTPDMSDLARTFAVAVVDLNRGRLLDGD